MQALTGKTSHVLRVKWKPGQAVGAYPGGYQTNTAASNVTSKPALHRADHDPSRPRGPVPGSLNQFFPFVPAGSPPWKIPAGACGLSGIPGTASIFFWRGHTSSNVLPS